VLAVTTYEWLTSAHVIAAVMWVGGDVMLTLLALMTLALHDPLHLARFMKQVAFLGKLYIPILSLMVIGFGFALVENGNWGYGPTWIQIGIAGWAATFALGAGYLGPNAKKIDTLIEARGAEDPEVQALIARVLRVARIDAVILLFMVFDMTAKPWS
jgi:hypothetical protein